MQLFDGKGGLVEGCIQSVSRAGLDIMAVEEPQVVPPQGIQWHVYAAFGESFYPYFSNNHTIISIFFWHVSSSIVSGTLKGGRADWLVEKCTVCHLYLWIILAFYVYHMYNWFISFCMFS